MDQYPQAYNIIYIPETLPETCTPVVKGLEGMSIRAVQTLLQNVKSDQLRELLEVVAPYNEIYLRSNNCAFMLTFTKEKILFYIAGECCETRQLRMELFRQYTAVKARRFIRFRALG